MALLFPTLIHFQSAEEQSLFKPQYIQPLVLTADPYSAIGEQPPFYAPVLLVLPGCKANDSAGATSFTPREWSTFLTGRQSRRAWTGRARSYEVIEALGRTTRPWGLAALSVYSVATGAPDAIFVSRRPINVLLISHAPQKGPQTCRHYSELQVDTKLSLNCCAWPTCIGLRLRVKAKPEVDGATSIVYCVIRSYHKYL